MKEESKKLVIDHNTIYEIDLTCLLKKGKQRNKKRKENKYKKSGA